MLSVSADQAFRRYRRTGDPASLSAVFDQTAPELLRLGRHLASTEAGAEDLLQATFLTAMQASADFDDRYPVLPWLVGVLANHARAARRRGQRTLDPSRLAVPAASDPVAAAASEELSSTLLGTIQRLPPSYRAVMRLHLEHGLTPAEIALTLERPAGTVRSQLSRGLDRVRRALPAAFAAGAASAQTTGRGLEAVRTTVLETTVLEQCRPQGAMAGAVAIAGGLTLLQKLAIGAAAAVLMVTAAYGTYRVISTWSSSTDLPTHSIAADSDPTATDDVTAAGAIAMRAKLPPAAAPTRGGLQVAVVRESDGSPATGVSVSILRPGEATRPSSRPSLQTDDAGMAMFADLAAGEVLIAVDRSKRRWNARIRAGHTDPFEVRLPRGIDIEGTVRTADGSPIPNAAVFGRCGALRGSRVARTDANGNFTVVDVPACYELHARKAGLARSVSHMVRGEVGTELHLDLIVSGPGHRVSGFVTDPDGRAVAEAIVALLARAPVAAPPSGLGSRRYEAIMLRADAHGRFETNEVSPGRHVVFARPPKSDTLAAGGIEIDVKPGAIVTADVTVQRAAVVEGRVLEDGMPQADVVVMATVDQPALDIGYLQNWFGSSTTRTNANGRYRLASLTPGDYVLRATNPRGQRTQERRLEMREGERRQWDVRFDRGRRLDLRIAATPNEVTPGYYIIALSQRTPDGGRQPHASRMADVQGRVGFDGLSEAEYEVAVIVPLNEFAANTITLTRRAGLRRGSGEVVVEIRREQMPSASFAGRVVNAAGHAVANSRVLAIRRDDGLDGRALVFSGEDGRFELGPLPAGTYSLKLEAGDHAQTLGPYRLKFDMDSDLGDLALSGL